MRPPSDDLAAFGGGATPDPAGRLRPLPRQSAASLIAERVRGGIVAGVFEPGAQIAEASLARSLRVSRGPVREALQRLVQEGLLESRPHRGVFVTDLPAEEIADVFLARRAVEGAAAARLIAAMPPDFVPTMEAHLLEMRRAAQSGAWDAVVDLDLGFHERIVEAARSRRLRRMFATLSAETRLCLLRLDRGYPIRDDLVDEHVELLALLRRRDEDGFLRALSGHFEAGVAALEAGDD